MKVVIASGNIGKIHEFRQLLAPFDMDIIPQTELTVTPVAETGLSFVENALIKARHAAQYTKLAALADDSGLVVPALQGKPGIYSARYAGAKASDHHNIEKLLHDMQALKDAQRNAYFYCALVFLRNPEDPTPIICTGQWWGKILQAPEGKNGFGYDPIFYVPEHDCASAHLTSDIKNQISHRGLALKALIKHMKKGETDEHQ